MKGDLVGDYEGRRYSKTCPRPDWDGLNTYLFALSDGTFIDGSDGGNATRHINHSCNPNVIAMEQPSCNGDLSVRIYAVEELDPGQELFLDYSLDVAGEDESCYPCHCGQQNCRGTLAGRSNESS